MRKQLLLAVAVLVALALVVVGIQWWQSLRMSEFQRAISLAPEGAQRLTYTDWAAARQQLDVDLDTDSPGSEVDQFLADAFEEDLSPMSALLESTPTMHDRFPFSPVTLDWELLSQSEEGAVVLMRMPEGTDFDALEDGIERLGYQRPEDEGDVWLGGIDLLPSIGILTPELQYLAVDADQRLVVSSDTEDYLRQAMKTVTGDADAVEGLDGVVDAVDEPLAAAVYGGEVACSSLAMGSADAADQDEAAGLLAAAGEVNPMTGFAMAVEPGLGVRVAMSFENEDQARANADSRAALASGPAPGQGGDFSDRFRLGTVSAEGSVMTMELNPEDGEYLLSDLTSGPVLFATC
ncbi:MAG: hypothetical protein WKF50_01080 [Nocardioides sp.]